jgi:hypothetical protein
MSSVSKNYTQRCHKVFEKLKNCALVREKRVDKHTCAEFEAIANGCAPVSDEEMTIVSVIREISKANTIIDKQTGSVKSAFLGQNLQHYSVVIGGIILAKNLDISDFAFILFSTNSEFCKVRSKIDKNATGESLNGEPNQRNAPDSAKKASVRKHKETTVRNSSSLESLGEEEVKNLHAESKQPRPENARGNYPARGRGKTRAANQQQSAPPLLFGDFIKLRDDIAEKVRGAPVESKSNDADEVGAEKPSANEGDNKITGENRTEEPAKSAPETPPKNSKKQSIPTKKPKILAPVVKKPRVYGDKDLAEDLVNTSRPMNKSWADIAEEED